MVVRLFDPVLVAARTDSGGYQPVHWLGVVSGVSTKRVFRSCTGDSPICFTGTAPARSAVSCMDPSQGDARSQALDGSGGIGSLRWTVQPDLFRLVLTDGAAHNQVRCCGASASGKSYL